MKKILPVCLLLSVLSVVSGGCVAIVAGGAAGAGTVAYIKGVASQDFPDSLQQTNRAAQLALNTVAGGYTVAEDKQNTLYATNANGKKIAITLEEKTEGITKVSVRVGTFGDEQLSRRILNEIGKNLK
ncbi:MAG: DUF3568 family protein [Pseudomonadota bacterium]